MVSEEPSSQALRQVLTQRGSPGLQAMLPHPAADSGFGSMLFKAQLSTSRLRANLEQEYQVIIGFVFKGLYEVRCVQDSSHHSIRCNTGVNRGLLARFHARLDCNPACVKAYVRH